jgi:hypothetical protein
MVASGSATPILLLPSDPRLSLQSSPPLPILYGMTAIDTCLSVHIVSVYTPVCAYGVGKMSVSPKVNIWGWVGWGTDPWRCLRHETSARKAGRLKFKCNHASCISFSHTGVPRTPQPHLIPIQVNSSWFLKGYSPGLTWDLFRESMVSSGKERGILKEGDHMLSHFSFRSVCGQSYDMEGDFDYSRTQTLSCGPAAQEPVSMAPPGGHLRNIPLQALSLFSKQPGTGCLTPGPSRFPVKAATPASAVVAWRDFHLDRLCQVSSTRSQNSPFSCPR